MTTTNPRLDLATALLSDVGRRRPVNEDCGRVVRPHDPGVLARRGVLAVVADGMGGHNAGDVASRLAVSVVLREYYASAGEPGPALAWAIEQANAEVHAASRRDPRLSGMGTTCTAFAVVGREAHCAHVGDSRLYLARGGRVYQMTEDHSSVRALVARGVLAADEARRRADRNVLLRAVGPRPAVEVTVWDQPFPVEDGDRFVVCSDGLHGLVTDEEIGDAARLDEPVESCARLVELANARGGDDNITVAVVAAGGARRAADVRETAAWRTA